MFFREGLPGAARGDWALGVTSPLCASELGARVLLGFFDPADIAADGSMEKFKRSRLTDITHGRISVQS
eukprot:3568530-Prorocentrum_lima.AAC.1